MALPGGIGSLRHRITLQSVANVKNELGEDERVETNVATVWASINQLSGREAVIARQQSADATHQIVIRYYAGLTTRHRILFGTRVFDIENVNDVGERHEYMILTVTEAQPPESS